MLLMFTWPAAKDEVNHKEDDIVSAPLSTANAVREVYRQCQENVRSNSTSPIRCDVATCLEILKIIDAKGWTFKRRDTPYEIELYTSQCTEDAARYAYDYAQYQRVILGDWCLREKAVKTMIEKLIWGLVSRQERLDSEPEISLRETDMYFKGTLAKPIIWDRYAQSRASVRAITKEEWKNVRE